MHLSRIEQYAIAHSGLDKNLNCIRIVGECAGQNLFEYHKVS